MVAQTRKIEIRSDAASGSIDDAALKVLGDPCGQRPPPAPHIEPLGIAPEAACEHLRERVLRGPQPGNQSPLAPPVELVGPAPDHAARRSTSLLYGLASLIPSHTANSGRKMSELSVYRDGRNTCPTSIAVKNSAMTTSHPTTSERRNGLMSGRQRSWKSNPNGNARLSFRN